MSQIPRDIVPGQLFPGAIPIGPIADTFAIGNGYNIYPAYVQYDAHNVVTDSVGAKTVGNTNMTLLCGWDADAKGNPALNGYENYTKAVVGDKSAEDFDIQIIKLADSIVAIKRTHRQAPGTPVAPTEPNAGFPAQIQIFNATAGETKANKECTLKAVGTDGEAFSDYHKMETPLLPFQAAAKIVNTTLHDSCDKLWNGKYTNDGPMRELASGKDFYKVSARVGYYRTMRQTLEALTR